MNRITLQLKPNSKHHTHTEAVGLIRWPTRKNGRHQLELALHISFLCMNFITTAFASENLMFYDTKIV